MDNASASKKSTKNANNPHKKMHSIIFFVVASCLTVQVLEGSFIVPYILVHFGYPDLSLKEICDEMYFIVYKDDERECNYPYPLFSEVEPWKYKDMRDVVGYPAPPRPHYKGFGFREVIKSKEEREARKALQEAENGGGDSGVGRGLKDDHNNTLNNAETPRVDVDSDRSEIRAESGVVGVRESHVLAGETK